MAESATTPGFGSNLNFIAFKRPDIVGPILQAQQQQALAQQLLAQANQQDDPAKLANPGGLVVPLSPWGQAAKALEKGAGSYLQGKAMADQLSAFKQLANPAPQANPQLVNALTSGAPMPGQVGPTQPNLPLAQALMSQGGSNQPGAGNTPSDLTDDPRFMQGAMMFGPEAAGKAYFESLTPTNAMKEYGWAGLSPRNYAVNTQAEAANKAGIPGAVLTPQGAMPIPNAQQLAAGMSGANAGAKAAAEFPYQTGVEQFKQSVTPYKQEAMVDGQPVVVPSNNLAAATGQVPPVLQGGNPNSMSPQGNGGPVNLTPAAGQPNVSLAMPAGAVKQAESEGGKGGENIADTEKTFNVVNSQLPRALQRFEQLRAAVPDASYGEGLTPNPDGTPGWKTRLNNQLGSKKTVLANQAIEQIGAQGILPEIGPVIASTGGRGNQFMEKMASTASGIGLPLQPAAKMQAIQNVEDQYIGNMKAQAAILRAHGRPAPTDQQIDAQVAQVKQGFAPQASGNNPPAPMAGRVKIQTPDGKMGTVDAAHLQDLLKAGGKVVQ